MCELFALNSSAPTGVRVSFAEFAAHGGRNGHNCDGWGVAYYDGPDVSIVREPEPASTSPTVRFLLDNNFRSNVVLSHIRRATRGGVALPNTQPFSRELMGRRHVFAHNGDLPGVEARLGGHAGSCFHPVGETDSELAFCELMRRLAPVWHGSDRIPSVADRLEVVTAFAAELRELGPANFLYSDGDAVFGHGDRRTHADGLRAPGLWSLQRVDHRNRAATPGLSIDVGTDTTRRVKLLASVPLSDEAWAPLAEGEVVVLQGGTLCERRMAR